MPSREELLAAGNRAYVIVNKATKVPVASADGVRTEIRQVKPGDLLSRADWDRFPERSRRSMVNTNFVTDPLSVRIDPIRNQPEQPPPPKAATVVLRAPGKPVKMLDAKTGQEISVPDPGGIDRRAQRDQQPATASTPKRKRGRPRKVRA